MFDKSETSRKRLYFSKLAKYLGVKIDENLNWKDQTYDILTKLNRANALLCNIRNYVSFITLKAIYFAIFELHINYAKSINLLPSIFKNWFSVQRFTTVTQSLLQLMNSLSLPVELTLMVKIILL